VLRCVLLGVLLAVLAASLLAGCSSADRPLARVGSQKVTVEDYRLAASGAGAQYRGLPDAAKAQLVQDLVSRAMMLELAHRLGHDTAAVVLRSDRDNERRALVQQLFVHIASPVQPVSEAEARALYEARKQEAQVSMIYASSRESALGAQARINAGEPFARVAQSMSLPGMLPPDGEMGPILPGSLPEPLDGAVRNLPVGVVGGPYETGEGWFLVKITRRRPHEQGSWEQQRSALFEQERKRKQSAALGRAYRDLKAEWQMEQVVGGSQLLFHVLSPLEPLRPTPEQRRTPLATYAGGTYTLQDALDELQDVSVQRPPAQLLPAVQLWIENQAMLRVAVLEARRRHLHEEPQVVAALRRQHEEMLLEGVYQNAVAGVPPPGPELVRMAWEQLKDRFTRLGDVRVASVVVADSSTLLKLIHTGANVRSLTEAVKQVDSSLAVTDTTVHYPNNDPGWNTLVAMFTQMQPGAWYGPEPLAHGWRILQMVDKTVIQQSFEELPPATQQNIAGSAAELGREARFRQFTDSLSRAYMPVIDRPLLAKLPWPVLAAADAAP
jgi:parvulin-like peptidyl-prolyl isomerase